MYNDIDITMSAVSLTDHRIDILFAKYIHTALKCNSAITLFTEFLIVTNGMYDGANPEVLKAMKEIPSIYLIDDHTCWVPNPEEFPLCSVHSQFTTHPVQDIPMDYFQVSKLALFDERFENIYLGDKINKLLYWGQYKSEREEEYGRHLPEGSHVIGRRYPTKLSKKWELLPFTKDLSELHKTISMYKFTIVFGDKLHNGVNLPYRIYEALMCGCEPKITAELLGDQQLDIGWILLYINSFISKEEYLVVLQEKRKEVVKELREMIEKKKPVNEVTEILAERGSLYGSYGGGVDCRVAILEALNEKHIECMGYPLPEDIRIMFGDIALKLMRAASNPSHQDSWLDLAGYGKLIHVEMTKEFPGVL